MKALLYLIETDSVNTIQEFEDLWGKKNSKIFLKGYMYIFYFLFIFFPLKLSSHDYERMQEIQTAQLLCSCGSLDLSSIALAVLNFEISKSFSQI